jgi:glycosyltransferase involved in cell wall biosynthesis
MPNSLIDIILPAYNGEAFLVEQLNSLIAQSYTRWNLFTVDDGSTDGTSAILRQYTHMHPDKIHLLPHEESHSGHIRSLFALMQASSAEYLMFCDQDDVWVREKVNITLERMKQLEERFSPETPLLVFTDLALVDKNLNVISQSFWAHQKIDPDLSQHWKKLIAQNVVTGCTMMLNRRAKETAMSMMEYLRHELVTHVIDHDRCIAISIAKSGHLGYVAVPTVCYRQHDANLTGALQYGVRYVFSKIKDGAKIVAFFHKIARYYPEVSVLELIYYKLTINVKRLIT